MGYFKKLNRDIDAVTYAALVRKLNPEWIMCCCTCHVPNGECNEIAREGNCKAMIPEINKEGESCMG